VITAHVSASNPYFPRVYPISRIVSLTIFWISTYAFVVISPITSTRPVVVAVSHATRLIGSFSIRASRIASEIASHILSGWPSVTDSEVNKIFSIVFSFFYSFTIVSRPQNNPQPFMYCINRLFLSADTFPLTKRNSPK